MTDEQPMSLALCFDAPMQSWGTRSRGVIRDTSLEPTKSGVVGLLAAALGIDRDNNNAIAELAQLRLAIRVDREGILERDYHTTQNVPTTQGTGHRTVVSERYYLADALFLVVLEGRQQLLTSVAGAVRQPHWRLSFGRKAFVPARPLLPPDAAPIRASAETVLTEHGWLEPSPYLRATAHRDTQRPGLRTVVECPPNTVGAEARYDHPITFTPGQRRFAPRTVLVSDVPLTDTMITTGESLCI
ncbi:type I-E CRISPR-associated protein Cas5/CasD [Actinocrispum wychmicini]|uniref:CRISPR system Cascade subunit CasD n=1 Tax=Actinocrispum wychmicini TaxID=1213861 RepID=A0A4R2JUK5_9PSEU|nr:type I-E CRISPR-associated protein Cas5/CasD [Actinocrispum wychmicini]TCO62887.1 CRISPR system Cascade subunit CasD [Actinocrispum wychmicini]